MDVVHGIGELDVPNRSRGDSRLPPAGRAAVHRAMHPIAVEAVHDRVSLQVVDLRDHRGESGRTTAGIGRAECRWTSRRRDRPRRRRQTPPCYCFAAGFDFAGPRETGESPVIAGPLTTLPYG